MNGDDRDLLLHHCSSLLRKWYLLEDRQGSEEVAGVAALVGVADELGVQLLVAGEVDAAGLFVVVLNTFCIISLRIKALV